MSENFDKMLKFVLLREGGYSNNPNDKGGKLIRESHIKHIIVIEKAEGFPLEV